jgi:multidrug efflux pump subunit AcrB
MTIVEIVISCFVALELSNVLTLYFFPGSRKANSVGVFTAWEKSKQHPEIHEFVKYLVYWVAGTKLVFILLLAMIIASATPDMQRISLVILAAATTSFYWRLFPLIRKMDRKGEIEPKNYSFTLGILISVFIAAFLVAAFS